MPTLRNMEPDDIMQVNGIISRAFTQGRMDDGYSFTKVPMCHTDFIRMYYHQNPDGCFVVEEFKTIRGGVFSHVWGKTGWIGPIAVAPEKHHFGFGKLLMKRSIDHLKAAGCTVIGLETNPRSSKNLGFYCSLGFEPHVLSLDLMKTVSSIKTPSQSPHDIVSYSGLLESDQENFISRMHTLCRTVAPLTDYQNLIKQVYDFKVGDAVLFIRRKVTIGAAILQVKPSLAEEQNAMLRVLVFLAHPQTPDPYLVHFLNDLHDYAQAKSLNRIVIRVPMYSNQMIHLLIHHGYRIINSDLRMTLTGYPEKKPESLHLNRWV